MADVAVQPIAGSPSVRWSLPHRFAFRFFCCYWPLYALPETGRVSLLPFGGGIFKPYEAVWHAVVPWVAIHVLGVTGTPATYIRTGSGDTTLQYVHQLLYVVVSLAAMALWSILDRRRPNYRTLDAWVRVLVRYNLAFTLFGYGFVKIVPLQFRPARFSRLMEPYGEFSPMGVLWSFMGASLPYVVYSGCAEALGGFLLLFRRTTSLGALVAFTVMLNVAALNYCYDVPVKLYSTNLVFMAAFLLLPDLGRLWNVLVRNLAVEPADLNPIRFERRWLRIGQVVCWVVVVGIHVVAGVIGGWNGYQSTYGHPLRVPHSGLYEVESGAPGNWRKVAIDFPNMMTVRRSDDTVKGFSTDTATWSEPDPEHVVIAGSFDGAPRTVRLKKVDARQIPLLNRGFHWINETPFNR
jgi:hypothetical protein